MAEASAGTPTAPGIRVLQKENPQNYPWDIKVASSSDRRNAAIARTLPGLEISKIPGGEEEDIDDVIEIARNKVFFARGTIEKRLHLVSERNPAAPKRRTAYIAGDTRTCSLAQSEHGHTVLVSKSHERINTENDIRQVFQDMLEGYEASKYEKYTTLPYYQIQSGSGILIEAPKTDPMLHATNHTSVIELDLPIIEKFSTPEGIKEYLEACDEFHASDLYKEVNASKVNQSQRTIYKIASGLELAVLVRIGAVTHITSADRIARNDSEFKIELYNALYNAFVGISPNLLNEIDFNASERANNWDWLNRVTNYALRVPAEQILEVAA